MTKLSVDEALSLAKSYLKDGKVAEAKDIYTSVLKHFPNNLEAKKALNSLSDKHSTLPANPIKQVTYIQLMDLVNNGQLEVAIQHTKNLLTNNNNDIFLLNILGIACAQLGRFDQAISAFKQITRFFPTEASAHFNLGNVLKDTGQIREAIGSYTKALELKPDYEAAFNNLSAVLRSQGQPAGGLQKVVIDKYLTLKKKRLDVANSLFISGNNFYELGKLDDAILAYKKAIELWPTFETAYNNLGLVFALQGKKELAIDAYKSAVSIDPYYADAYNNLGNVLSDSGEIEDAIGSYQKVIDIAPENADAHYNLGLALMSQCNFEAAVEIFSVAVDLDPNYADAFNNMGIALYEQGKLEEAAISYVKTLSIQPNHKNAYVNIVELLKTYSPITPISHTLFSVDEDLKKINNRFVISASDDEISQILLDAFEAISQDQCCFETTLSQIYKRNSVDINCRRHKQIFEEKDIIPEFCFGCFKVQVEVTTLFDLIRLTAIFYDFEFTEDLSTKTLVELRENISGNYKGLIYCRGLNQAHEVKHALDLRLRVVFGSKAKSYVKRGCSEFPLRFPDYGKIENDHNVKMSFPKDWKKLEDQFDRNNIILPKEGPQKSISSFCASDFYILRKWIDYAKGLGDKSSDFFDDIPITFHEVYELARSRRVS